MTKKPKNYKEAREAVGELLRLHAQEYSLERKINGDEHSEFTSDRAVGVLAFLLSTVAVKHSVVWEVICNNLIEKARQVAILESKLK